MPFARVMFKKLIFTPSPKFIFILTYLNIVTSYLTIWILISQNYFHYNVNPSPSHSSSAYLGLLTLYFMSLLYSVEFHNSLFTLLSIWLSISSFSWFFICWYIFFSNLLLIVHFSFTLLCVIFLSALCWILSSLLMRLSTACFQSIAQCVRIRITAVSWILLLVFGFSLHPHLDFALLLLCVSFMLAFIS